MTTQGQGQVVRQARARVVELVAKSGARWARAVADVLGSLLGFVDREGRARPAQSTIAGLASYSLRHVQRALAEAERVGLLLRAVPRFAARMAGTATEYALPWAAVTLPAGVEGLASVVGRRAGKGPLAVASDAQARALLDAVERANPAELLRRVARRLPGDLAREVVRSMAPELHRASVAHATRRPDKTSDSEPPRNSVPARPAEPAREARPAVQGAPRAPESTGERLGALGARLRAIVADRV